MAKEIFCPVCEKDFELPKNELRKSTLQRGKTGGKVLIGCWKCARVLQVLDAPEGTDKEVVRWAAEAEKNDDWLSCVPLLDSETAKIPSGSNADLSYVRYQAGQGGDLLDRRAYMMRYGVDPLIHMTLNPSMGGAAFKITDSRR